jgi:hypothetical protein
MLFNSRETVWLQLRFGTAGSTLKARMGPRAFLSEIRKRLCGDEKASVKTALPSGVESEPPSLYDNLGDLDSSEYALLTYLNGNTGVLLAAGDATMAKSGWLDPTCTFEDRTTCDPHP